MIPRKFYWKLILLILILAYGPWQYVSSATYGFNKIIDSKTLIPGKEDFFQRWNGPQVSNENIAFLGENPSGTKGIYLFSNGILAKIVDEKTPLPNEKGTFSKISSFSLDQNSVAFHARGSGSSSKSQANRRENKGIWLWRNGTMQKIVVPEKTIKGTGKPLFGGESRSFSLSGESIAYLQDNIYFHRGPLKLGESRIRFEPPVVFFLRDKKTTKIIDENTLFPQSSISITNLAFGITSFDDNKLAFIGSDENRNSAIYLFEDERVQLIADQNTSIPEGSGTFTSFSLPAQSYGNVVFHAAGSNQKGIYLYKDGELLKIVDLKTPISDNADHFSYFRIHPSIYKDTVAFLGFKKSLSLKPADQMTNEWPKFSESASIQKAGIYIFRDGEIHKVIESGDMLESKIVTSLSIGENCLSKSLLAFSATFSDGSSAIYTARVVSVQPPRPSAPSSQPYPPHGRGDLRKGTERSPRVAVTTSMQNSEPAVSGIRDAATFVSDVTIPVWTVTNPGQRFTKTWKIRNSGFKSWEDYNLAFVGGAQMDAPYFVSVPITPSGQTADISVQMTAPKDAGGYVGKWQMRTANGELFGERLFASIQVNSSTYQGRTFEDWKEDLQAQSPVIRKNALEALFRFGPKAKSAVIETHRSDPDEDVRAFALAALADIKPPGNDAVRVFFQAATDSSPDVRMTAIMIIREVLPSRIGAETVPALVEVLRDTNTVRRQLAIRLLAHLGPTAKEAVPTLRMLADNDPEPRVRNIADNALKLIERRGAVSGDRYVSARNWFSVAVPKSSNRANLPFSLQDTSVNQPKGSNYDLVNFKVKDFGEVLIAGVRQIPDGVLEKITQDDNQTVLSFLSDEALHSWRKFVIKPNVAEETYLSTTHGESILRVYNAEKGSLLLRASGRRPTEADTFDTLIAVIAAKQKNHYVFAIAENDAEDNSIERKEALKHRVQSFFSSVAVNR